jgi:hypothetical protein
MGLMLIVCGFLFEIYLDMMAQNSEIFTELRDITEI